MYVEVKAAGQSADTYTRWQAQSTPACSAANGPGTPYAESKPITFRLDAAQLFDDRCQTRRMAAGTVSV